MSTDRSCEQCGKAFRSSRPQRCCSKKCSGLGRRGTAMYLTHDMSRTTEYRSWTHMRWRTDPKNAKLFPNYAGRGISTCARWRKSFESFIADMGTKPFPAAQLDRIDNDGNYTPKNCRWASKKEQANNRRPRPPGLFKGEKNGQAKIKAIDAAEIRRLEKRGTSRTDLMAKFNLGRSQIARICRGESW